MNLSINSDAMPSSFKNTLVTNDSITIVRSNLNNIHDIGKWVEEFSIKTNTRGNVRTTVPIMEHIFNASILSTLSSKYTNKIFVLFHN